MHRQICTALSSCLLFLSIALQSLAQTQTPGWRVEIESPAPGATLGGVVSVLGTVSVDGLLSHSLAFGLGTDPQQWIAIGQVQEEEISRGRLAFWDTTGFPDGVYTLRLRAVRRGEPDTYIDSYVRPVHVSNAPRTSTPRPTPQPSATPTITSTPTPTQTPVPALALADGISPYLYVAMSAQYDPLCPNWQQRYSIWLSNVGMTPLTNVVVTDVPPASCDPVLAQSSRGARELEGRGMSREIGTMGVVWKIGTMAPGAAVKLELQVDVPPWLPPGTWLNNEVRVSSDQLPYVGKTVQTLLSECPWLRATEETRTFELPTSEPRPTRTATPELLGKPTLQLTPTPLSFTIPEETVERGLNIFTVIVAVGLGILVLVTGVLFYRWVRRRR